MSDNFAKFAIEVNMHAQTLRQFYYDKETAEAEVAKIVPLLGIPSYSSKRNDSSSETHTIAGPMGDLNVVLDKVEAVRVIDLFKWDQDVAKPINAINAEEKYNEERKLLLLKRELGFTS